MKVSKQILVPAETHHMFMCAAGHGYTVKPMPKCSGTHGPPTKWAKGKLLGLTDGYYSGNKYWPYVPCSLPVDVPFTWTVAEHFKTVYQCSACKKWVANVYSKVPLHFGLHEYCESSGALCKDCQHLWLDVNFFANALAQGKVKV